MSIRAYPIIKIEYSAPLFNLWHDEEIADELMRQGYLKGADENGGYIDAPVSLIKELIAKHRPENLPYLNEFLEKQELTNDDWMEFVCF